MLWMAVALVLSPAQFEESVVESARSDIQKFCGTKPPIEISWTSFGDDLAGRSALISSGIGFLTLGLKNVCADKTLRLEFGNQIQKIVIAQAYGAGDPMIYVTENSLHVEYLWVKGEAGPDLAFVGDEIASRLRGEDMEAP